MTFSHIYFYRTSVRIKKRYYGAKLVFKLQYIFNLIFSSNEFILISCIATTEETGNKFKHDNATSASKKNFNQYTVLLISILICFTF